MSAIKIVERMLGRSLLESPQLYPGAVVYQADQKFRPITHRNFSDYIILDQDDTFVYALDPQLTTGFVFLLSDVAKRPSLGMIPVLHVQLRDSGVKSYKQAFHLRIRQDFAIKGVTTRWYLAYVNAFGGIVSDREHLEGGKNLWKSFVRTATERGLTISLVNTVDGSETPVSETTPESLIWSTGPEHRDKVLVLEK